MNLSAENLPIRDVPPVNLSQLLGVSYSWYFLQQFTIQQNTGTGRFGMYLGDPGAGGVLAYIGRFDGDNDMAEWSSEIKAPLNTDIYLAGIGTGTMTVNATVTMRGIS